jgi:hypothetical protein
VFKDVSCQLHHWCSFPSWKIDNFVILETIFDATLSTRMSANDGVDKISWIISFLEMFLLLPFLKNMMVFLDIDIQQVMLVQLQWMVYIYTHVYMTVKDLHAQHWWLVGTSIVFLMTGKILKILERYNPNILPVCVKSLIA